jgi:mevalonate kinase
MTLELHPEASACGKLILVGEHAAVYGFPALAVGLPDSLRLRAEPLRDRLAPMQLSIPAWEIDLVLTPDLDHDVGRAALEVLSFCDGPVTGWRIAGDTTLPARAGLGSSACLTVALARLALGPHADTPTIVQASMRGERIFHGEPSGIDSEVATRGGLVRFVRGEPVEPIPLRHPLRLLVVPSGVPRSTARQVANVRARYDRLPMLQRPALALMGTAAGAALEAINSNDLNKLGEIMDICHGLLVAVGVSSPILDELCSVAREHGARGAKLTGAGGGGCILALPPDPETPLLHTLRGRGLTPLLVDLVPTSPEGES